MSIAASNDTQRTTEDAYRARWTWDSVAWGSHCVDCYPGNCTYRVFVRDGKIVREEAAATYPKIEDGVPDFNPMGCNKGAAWSQQLYDGDRLMHPLRRVGPRGSGQWERISWEEAGDQIADAMLDAIEKYGPESIAHEGTPEIATVVPTNRFFNTIGGRSLDLHASFNDFSIGLHETFGKFCPVSSADDWFKSELILIWHMNPGFTRIPFYHFMLEARYNGAEIISISPDLNSSHTHSDFHVPVEPASDAALGLAMVQVILEEGIEDRTFIREQTDLPMLVRTDTKRFLRQTDVEGPTGNDEQLYHWDPEAGLFEADRGHMLLYGREVALEGTYTVNLHDGTQVEVEPVLQMLRRHLNENYTPESTQETTRVHPEVTRMIARKSAANKTNIMLGWNSCKYYHGDLIERAMCLLLAVTGNWGKFGTGIRSWTAGMFDGQGFAIGKQTPGIDGTEAIIQGRQNMIDSIKDADKSITTDELAVREMSRMLPKVGRMRAGADGPGGSTGSPMAFWWYWHGGYDKRWNKREWGDDSLPRSFDEYFNEALEMGWWEGVDGPRPDESPHVLIECGGNMLRRTRGGKEALIKTLWEKLDLIVSIDFRINQTGLHSDILLPAAQHYEKPTFHIPTPHVMQLVFSDRAAQPAGEAKSEWNIYQYLLERFAQRAAARGVTEYHNARGGYFRPAELLDRFTIKGYFADEDKFADEVIRDCALAETIPEDTTLATLREKGMVRFTGWGKMPMALAQASPFEHNKTHAPFRSHVEDGDPFPTYARRAQFYIDHPWWMEAGEALPVHKPNPKAGGDYPLAMTSGHNRWSIHSMNQANPVILQTHRGQPAIEVSVEDAAARGVADDDMIRVWNDISSFTGRAKVCPTVKPGQIISYNGWDGHQYVGWAGANELEAGMVKWIGFAGGYGHIQYMSGEWQPIPSDRAVPCEFERVEG